LFSPNFEYRIDVNFSEEQFYIVSTDLAAKPLNLRIPSDLLSLETDSNNGVTI
jgi:hypothetical protein